MLLTLKTLLSFLPDFLHFNLLYQQDELNIHILYESIVSLVRAILIKFIKPDVISSTENILELGFEIVENQVQNEDIIMSVAIHTEIQDALESGDLSPAQCEVFFRGIREFLVEAVKKTIKIFPLQCEVLKMLSVLDPRKRLSINNSVIVKLAKQFSNVISSEELDSLVAQFAEYRTISDAEITLMPPTIDEFWGKLELVMVPGTREVKYGVLCRLCKALCVLPHSNAECEHIFCMVRHIKTDFRNQLSNTTLCSLLAIKRNELQNQNKTCFNVEISKDLLSDVKKQRQDRCNNKQHPA